MPLLLAALLAAQPVARTAEPPADRREEARPAPLVLKLPTGYLFNQPAFDVVDAEMKRLQRLERLHREESWLGVVLTGVAVGLVLGAGAVGLLWYLKR